VDPKKASGVTEHTASCNFTTDWGTRIVSEKAKFFAPGGYHTGSVWPLFTGWASLGDYSSGYPVQGFSKMMSNLLIYKNWSLGYIEEVLHGIQYKYFGVCRHQCWSETMVLQPAIEGMLGLKPDAMADTLDLSLNFPFDWDSVRVDNIRMGEHILSLHLNRKSDQTQILLTPLTSLTSSTPSTHLHLPFPNGTTILNLTVNSQAFDYKYNNNIISLNLKPGGPVSITVNHKRGISVLPLVHHPEPGDSSTGLKIISDKLDENFYRVEVEGPSGTRGMIRLIESGKVTIHQFTFPESKEKYTRKELVFNNPDPKNEVFYYVLVRSFYDSDGDGTGDLNGLRQKLDYLRDLGVTSILTLPLQESEFYHNYFTTDYRKIDAEYGTMDDLISLIREVHRKGMKFYLDMETQYVTEGSDWYANNPDFQLIGTPWGRLLSYNGESRGMNMAHLNNPKVKQYFHELYRFFVDPNGDGRFDDGVDGFRIDHIMDDLDNQGRLINLYAGFWKPLFDGLREVNPGIRIIGEQADWGSYGEEVFREADLDYLFAFRVAMTLERLDKRKLTAEIENTWRATPDGKDQLIFIENHDLDRFASRVRGNLQKQKVAAAFNILLKGIPLIYYGQELGMKGVKYNGNSDGNDIPRREAFEWYMDASGPGMAFWYRNSGPWWTGSNVRPDDGISLEEEEPNPASLFNFYKKLLALRGQHAALIAGTMEFIGVPDPGVVAFSRKYGNERILVVINLTNKVQSPNIRDYDLKAGQKVLLNEPGINSLNRNILKISPYGIIIINID
jgi:glycosidase